MVDINRGMKELRLSDKDPGHGRRETVREARECEYLKPSMYIEILEIKN